MALATRGTDLIIFGSKSTEFWTNTGNADFPFELQAYRGFGCYSAGSVSEISALVGGSMVDSVIWCATDERGKFAGVYLLSGYEAIKISDYDLDRLIEADPSPEALRGFAWSENGHSFYAIRGASFCYVYDTKEQVWHERRSFGQDTWSISRHETFRGLTLFGDAATGNIYRSDINLYEADDQSIQMEIQIPITHAWPYELILNRVAVDAVTGTGANTTDADLASPEIVFDMSLDGGANFGTELHRSLGAQGQTQTSMNWFGLGRIGRTGTVLRFRLSPGVKRIVMGAAVDVDRLAA